MRHDVHSMPGGIRAALVLVFLAVAMVLCAFAGRRQRLPALTLVLLSFVWFGVDNTWEGPVLLPVAPQHGLTASDLPGVAGLIAAIWLLTRRRS